MRNKNQTRGMTLVEVIVAMALFGALLLGLGPLMVKQVHEAGRNVTRNRLSVVANNVLERYHSLPPSVIASLVGTRQETVVTPTRPGEQVFVQITIQPSATDTQSYEIHVRAASSLDPNRLFVDAWSLKQRESP